MGRVYNFSAGPAVLPEEVLKEAADGDYPFVDCFLTEQKKSGRAAERRDVG